MSEVFSNSTVEVRRNRPIDHKYFNSQDKRGLKNRHRIQAQEEKFK